MFARQRTAASTEHWYWYSCSSNCIVDFTSEFLDNFVNSCLAIARVTWLRTCYHTNLRLSNVTPVRCDTQVLNSWCLSFSFNVWKLNVRSLGIGVQTLNLLYAVTASWQNCACTALQTENWSDCGSCNFNWYRKTTTEMTLSQTCCSLTIACRRADRSSSVVHVSVCSCSCRSASVNFLASATNWAWTSTVCWRRWQQANCARVRDFPKSRNAFRTELRRWSMTSQWLDVHADSTSHSDCSESASYSTMQQWEISVRWSL